MSEKEDKFAERRTGRTNVLKGGRPPQRRTFGHSAFSLQVLNVNSAYKAWYPELTFQTKYLKLYSQQK